MVTNKLNKYNYIGIVVSIIGLSLCIALIQEFFGSAGGFVESLCSATGDGDSCGKVAKSMWSGFRGLPLLGDVAVAHIGFTFYGFCGFIFFSILKSKEDSRKGFVFILYFLSGFAILIDLVFFVISISQIGTVCILCAFTYVVSLCIFALAFIQVKSYSVEERNMNQIKNAIGENVIKNILNYLIVALVFYGCGMGIGKFSTSSNDTSMITDPEKEKLYLNSKLEAFDKAPSVKIELKDAPMVGNPKATVTIVKFADFNCGHCMHTSHIIRQILADYPDQVKVYYKNFPLDGTCNPIVQRKDPSASSCIAASAALCANKQGKFKEMYNGLYADNENGIRHSVTTIREIAVKVGLNMQQLISCMGSSEIQSFILKEAKEGELLNVQSTPTLFINNKPIDPGTPNPNFLKALIDHLLNK